MPFIIPDNDVATWPDDQSVWMSADIQTIVQAIAGLGVKTGCEVTAQGTPDMTVAVASGTVYNSVGAEVGVSAGNVNINAADGTNPRIDLVSIDPTDGSKDYTAGTAAAAPKPPTIPSGNIPIAFVYVPASDTDIDPEQIIDKRVLVGAPSSGSTPGGAGVAATIFDPARDTYLSAAAPTTNYGTSTEMLLSSKYDGSDTSFTKVGLMAFDISVLAGLTIYSAVVHLQMTAKSNSTDEQVNNHVIVRRNLRSWVEAEATYNVYSTGNSWTTAGAVSDGNDVENDILCWFRHGYMPGPGGSGVVITGGEASKVGIDVLPILNRAMSLSLSELNLQFNEWLTTTSKNPTSFATKDHATLIYRPRLIVLHSDPAAGDVADRLYLAEKFR